MTFGRALFIVSALLLTPAANCPATSSPPVEETRVQKRFAFTFTPENMRPLATSRGGAIVSDKVTVEGRRVGYMYRGNPARDEDSGWRFLAGDEDETFMSDASNHSIFDVNTIANHDPAIVPYLDAPFGSAFYRNGDRFVPDPLGPPGD